MFDAKLKEGVEYFEQMLKVMPDDRTTLEFLAVAYPQLGENEKAEHALTELARVLIKEGDSEHAVALLDRLEACTSAEARTMAVRVKALAGPRPDLTPETAAPKAPPGSFGAACESEADLADNLGDGEIAAQLRALGKRGREGFVSALAMIEKDKPEACETAISFLADEFGEVPIPLDAFEPDRKRAATLGEKLVKTRGVIPFAALGDLALVAYLSPHDEALKREVTAALGPQTRFYLAEPRYIEGAIAKLYGGEEAK